MHINVVCPQCRSRYQVDDALLGKKMRCPNSKCKAVFDVVAEGGAAAPAPAPAPRPAAPPPSRSGQSGSVGDMVPMLSAEAAPPSPTPAPALGPTLGDWRNVPPRGSGTPAAPPPPAKPVPPTVKLPATTAKKSPPPKAAKAPPRPQTINWRDEPPPVSQPGETREAPVEMPPGAWDTPAPTIIDPSHEDEEEAIRAAKKQRNRRRMIMMVVACLLILGGGGIFAWMKISESEDGLYARAKADYDDGKYTPAGILFRKIADKYSSSSRVPEYLFYANLCDLQAASDADDIAPALKGLNQFITEQQTTVSGKQLLDERARDLGQILIKVSNKFLTEQAAKPEDAKEEPLKEIEGTVGRVARLLTDSITAEEKTDVANRIRELRAQIAIARDRRKALTELAQMAKKSGAEGIKEAKRFLREKAQFIPDLENHPEAQKILGEMHDAHLKTIVYTETTAEADKQEPRRPEDSEPSLLLDPFVAGPQPGPIDDGTLALAVARGVLYGLYPSNGQIKWAMRVGIDTAQLPVRLPPNVAHPNERLLVISGDARLLTCLDLDGRRLWERRLGSSCLGRPLIVKNRAYVPTVDGQVHEIELAAGKVLGRWNFGQPLSVGGVHQKDTNLVYFPADDTCVYVIDVEKRQCELVLYTNHSAGSLRGEPLVIGDNSAAVAAGMPAHLLLTQATGVDETTLKPYELPIKDRHQLPVSMEVQPRIQGWTWFTPFADSEKVVCLSDAARLGLFGIRQARNPDDPLLFPLVPGQTGLDLTDFLKKGEGERRGRALVAHVQGDDLWVLAHGRLQRLEVRLNRRLGPEAIARWKDPLELGSPLHAQEVHDDAIHGTTLHLVTQPLGRPVVLATAIDPEGNENAGNGDGRLRWQRQLGMVCQGQPLLLDGEVLAMDRAGGLFRFKPKDYVTKPGDRWLGAARDVGVAVGMDQGDSEPPQLIRIDDKTVYAVANPGGTRLIVRKYQTPGNGGAPKVSEQEVNLQGARPAGNVAALGDWLLVPLNTGKLVRYKLPLEQRAMPDIGPNWNTRVAGARARCHVVPLGGDAFLTTDGLTGVTHWQWKDGPKAILPPGQRGDPPTVKLQDRVVSAPLVLPRARPTDPLQVIVADSGRVLTLLSGDTLLPGSNWKMPGRITAGPFLRGSAIGCVVDQTSLVWVDPTKEDKPLWQFKTEGQAIVGEPHRIDDLIVVCDEGGRYVGLDPATGKPAGKGYHLKAVVAPAATPVPFGKDRAFAPLTDGTMMLLALDRLRAGK